MSLIAKPLPPNQQARLDQAEARAEIFLYWLLQLFMAGGREGWEEGMTFSEAEDAVHSVLANEGLDPDLPKDEQRVRRLMARKPIYGTHQDYMAWRIGR